MYERLEYTTDNIYISLPPPKKNYIYLYKLSIKNMIIV